MAYFTNWEVQRGEVSIPEEGTRCAVYGIVDIYAPEVLEDPRRRCMCKMLYPHRGYAGGGNADQLQRPPGKGELVYGKQQPDGHNVAMYFL